LILRTVDKTLGVVVSSLTRACVAERMKRRESFHFAIFIAYLYYSEDRQCYLEAMCIGKRRCRNVKTDVCFPFSVGLSTAVNSWVYARHASFQFEDICSVYVG